MNPLTQQTPVDEDLPQAAQDITIALTTNNWNDAVEQIFEEIEPWELSVVSLARFYRHHLESLNRDDFLVPGRMVLACAVLIRLKADYLGDLDSNQPGEDEESEPPPQQFGDYEQFREDTYIPTLDLPIKAINPRSPSKSELQQAKQDALRISERRESRQQEGELEENPPGWGIDLGGTDGIRSKLDHLFQVLKSKISQGKRVLFSHLLQEQTREEQLSKFIQLLHLDSEGKVKCNQNDLFGEIEVELAPDQDEE